MALSDIQILQNLRKNQAIKNANKQALDKSRVIVNTQAKPFFDNAPKPSDFLLKKQEKRIVNNATFDETPKQIFEQNIPFSQPRSAKQIVEANLGKDFFKSNKSLAVATVGKEGTGKVKGSQSDLQKNPVLAISNAFSSLFGGLFK